MAALGTVLTTTAVATIEDGVTVGPLTNTLNTNDNLSISRTFADAGDAIDVAMGGSTTGNALTVVMTAGASGLAADLSKGSSAEGGVNIAELIELNSTGTGAEAASILIGDNDPNGNVTSGPVGSLFIDAANAALYIKTGASAWSQFDVGGTGGTLQQAYAAGNTIAVTAANGSVTISNAADTTDTLSVDRTFAGAGVGIDVTMGASTTGHALDITMTTGASGLPLRLTDGTEQTRLLLNGLEASQPFALSTDAQLTADTGGDAITVQPGDGGAASASAGGKGGAINLNAGDGGAGAAAQLAGLGGDLLGTAGSAGAAAGGGGVAGGTVQFTAGTGSAADATFAGGGGPANFRAGIGGAGTGAVAAGAGGSTQIRGGVGGASSGVSGTAGAGGAMSVLGGDAGADGGGTGAVGGNVVIRGGNASGAAADGTITIGDLNTSSVAIGSATGDLGFFGQTPASQSPAYTVTNPSDDRIFDVTSTTLNELARVLGTVITDLQALGLLG